MDRATEAMEVHLAVSPDPVTLAETKLKWLALQEKKLGELTEAMKAHKAVCEAFLEKESAVSSTARPVGR